MSAIPPRLRRAALVIAWAAPCAALLSVRSPLALFAAAALAASACAALLSEREWPALRGEGAEVRMFDFDRAASLRQSFLPGVILAAAAHVCVALIATGRLAWAALALGAAVFAALWRVFSLRGLPVDPGLLERRGRLSFVLAVVFTLIAALPPGGGGNWFFGSPSAASAARPPAPGAADAGGKSASFKPREGGEHYGVVIWPEIEPHAVLVPPLPALRSNPFENPRAEPLAIPFFGVYWLYKFPERRPLPGAFETRGRPDRLKFRSTDWRPLVLEARQNLGRTFELLCCSRIEVEIANADPIPNSVMIDLALLDSTRPHLPPVALGRARVRSYARAGEPPASETLAFSLPASPARFDEFQVRFHLAGHRANLSPLIAIERFRLIPRR